MESYLDTSVASYILNGELWQRQPAMLMAHRRDMYAAWCLADESLADTVSHHDELSDGVRLGARASAKWWTTIVPISQSAR
jgi:hypothetical protein